MGLKLALVAGNGYKGQPLGKVTRVDLHWSAGGYRTIHDKYHFSVAWDADAKRACVVRALRPTQLGAHLWGRNGGSIGVALCAMGPGAPVMREQVIAAGQLVGEICFAFNLLIGAHVTMQKMACDADNIWPVAGNIVMPVIGDHAMFAKADGYWPDRSDVGSQEANPARNYHRQITDLANMTQHGLAKKAIAPSYATFMK